MKPATLTASAIATLVITKTFEKTGEKLTDKALEEGGNLLSLLKRKYPTTAKAIELAQRQPFDPSQALLIHRLETAAKQDSEIAQAIASLAREAKTYTFDAVSSIFGNKTLSNMTIGS
jgi:hypothetical protein